MGEDNHESSDDELLAVASAEEYAAKIIKLQQACLIPLKEDLAEWLNKILKTSNITTENFMDKLDNGVVICRLAKIISLWCEQELTKTDKESNTGWVRDYLGQVSEARNVPDSRAPSAAPFISVSSTNIHLPRNDRLVDANVYESPSETRKRNLQINANHSRINCLTSSASATSLNNTPSNYHSSNHFLDNLIRMHQTKIWADAKCRTFYARDNVCNFIKWSKDFGVNRSVLFESDDLVLHANPRQVVLCLLDVARIAYVKYGFTEAPGLVKFEQEIDKQLHTTGSNCMLFPFEEQPLESLVGQNVRITSDAIDIDEQTGNDHRDASQTPNKTKRSMSRKKMEPLPIDATDKLVMRYCRHKEETRRKSEELAAAAALSATSSLDSTIQVDDVALSTEQQSPITPVEQSKSSDENRPQDADSKAELYELEPTINQEPSRDKSLVIENNAQVDSSNNQVEIMDSMMPFDEVDLTLDKCNDYTAIVSSTTCDPTHNKKNSADIGHSDSLDEAEGPTESASTGYSSQSMGVNPAIARRKCNQSTNHTSIPVTVKRTNYSQSQTSYLTETSTKSELSSSRSSLLSVQDGNMSNSNYERQATSDLDGKVMRIAKSYYGKKATKDITRLSEGKYKIADRIVFVRLLKGHRVMVRIGGGWDTLENFLFRHKSDPSHVIDPDNLLPLETKMPFDKIVQATPTKSTSRLPYYRINNSASSNSLSLSNLSISKHSLINSTSRIAQHDRGKSRGDITSKSEHSSPMIEQRLKQPRFPHQFNAHKGHNNVTEAQRMDALLDDLPPSQSNSLQKNRILQATTFHNTPESSNQIKRPFYYQKTTASNSAGKYYHHRPKTSSLAQAASVTNINSFDSSSPVQSQAARRDRGPNRKLLLK